MRQTSPLLSSSRAPLLRVGSIPYHGGAVCVSQWPLELCGWILAILVGSLMPNRSRGREQTKSDPLVLQVGGWGVRLTILPHREKKACYRKRMHWGKLTKKANKCCCSRWSSVALWRLRPVVNIPSPFPPPPATLSISSSRLKAWPSSYV